MKGICRYTLSIATLFYANGHTTLRTPLLVRSAKLSSVGSGQYLDGWPPGNTRCCWHFIIFMYYFFLNFLFYFHRPAWPHKIMRSHKILNNFCFLNILLWDLLQHYCFISTIDWLRINFRILVKTFSIFVRILWKKLLRKFSVIFWLGHFFIFDFREIFVW